MYAMRGRSAWAAAPTAPWALPARGACCVAGSRAGSGECLAVGRSLNPVALRRWSRSWPGGASSPLRALARAAPVTTSRRGPCSDRFAWVQRRFRHLALRRIALRRKPHAGYDASPRIVRARGVLVECLVSRSRAASPRGPRRSRCLAARLTLAASPRHASRASARGRFAARAFYNARHYTDACGFPASLDTGYFANFLGIRPPTTRVCGRGTTLRQACAAIGASQTNAPEPIPACLPSRSLSRRYARRAPLRRRAMRRSTGRAAKRPP